MLQQQRGKLRQHRPILNDCAQIAPLSGCRLAKMTFEKSFDATSADWERRLNEARAALAKAQSTGATKLTGWPLTRCDRIRLRRN